MNGNTMGLRISSRYLCAFKLATIKRKCVCCYACPYHNPQPPWGTLFTTLTLYTWSAVVRPVGRTAIFFKTTFHYLSTALVDSPAISMTIACTLKTWDICGIVLGDKTDILEWPFIVPSTRCTCVMIMLFNQLLDMPYLSGGWITLAKEKCSLTGKWTNLCTKC